MDRRSNILVIVVSYNALRWIDRCLGSVINSTVLADVLVVDNGSTDGTPMYIEKHFECVELICNDCNLGFGGGNNVGLRLAMERGYEYVYLLNQDAWLEADTLERLLMATRTSFGVLSPLQKDAKGELDWNFRRKCGKYLAKAGFSEAGCAQGAGFSMVNSCSAEESVVEVPFVMAAHWLVSVELIRKVGLFSPVFNQYGEDDNYIDRLHYWGYRCGVVMGACAVHDRVYNKNKQMKLKCLSSVVRLSNPCRPFLVSAVLEPLRLVGTAVKNLSFEPLVYIFGLLRRYGELRRQRKETMKIAST